MAFVHHQPRQQRRDRQDHASDTPTASFVSTQHRQERDQDWSIVFPGRSREAPRSPVIQLSSPSRRSVGLPAQSPTTSSNDQSDDSAPLALTLPPLHDGTGRFLASPNSPSSIDVASIDAANHYSADDDRLSEARHSEDVFPESIFSGTESQLDADEEVGFGSGSDFDFESDAVASSHPSRSSVRRGVARTASRRRPSRSKLSHVSNGSDDEDAAGSHLLGSKAWSLLARSNALERVLESPSASSQLYTSAQSSRQIGRSRRAANDLPVVLTSGSEREDEPYQPGDATYDADLAGSNLAASAGLSHLDHRELLRRPKRRHRRSAAGRSSKRSNTSQSLLSIDYESRLLTAHQSRRHIGGAETPRSAAAHESRLVSQQQHASKTTRVIGSILRKVFDLEPEVLDAFLQEERSGTQAAAAEAKPGFTFEASEVPLATAPTGEMMLDGRSENERYPSSETEAEAALRLLDPATSPLFSNAKPVSGEELDDSSAFRLTEAALLQRNTRNPSPSLMEPTTMEALSAFVNTMVMPVPMPFRLLGALFGWSSIWSPTTSSHKHPSRAEQEEEEETASREAEEERKYRYERLLSAQQAKAWSRKYRGILFANVEDEEPSPDVPELWRGEEHPAIAGSVGSSD